MASEGAKTYYWIKLTEDFFDGEEIKIIENMPNGKDYIIFYLKLLLKTMNTNGELTFRGVMPYSVEMLSAATNTNPDIIRSAIDIFLAFDMMEKWDNGHLFMVEVQHLVGSETGWAKKKRIQRTNARLKRDNVPQMSLECPTEYRDKSIEIRDKSKEYRDKSIEIRDKDKVADKSAYPEIVEKKKVEDDTPYKQIIEMFNIITGKKLKHTSETHRKHIRARWKEGYTLDEFEHVVRVKSRQWLGDAKTEAWLTPKTLFGPKMDNYVNERLALTNQEKQLLKLQSMNIGGDYDGQRDKEHGSLFNQTLSELEYSIRGDDEAMD